MSRFINRMLPLFLAVILLLSAAGTAFFVVLGGSRILAEDSEYSIEAVTADGKDLLTYSLTSNTEIKELTIKLIDSRIQDGSDYEISEVYFNTTTFLPNSPEFDSAKPAVEAGKCTYTIVLKNVTYNIGNTLDFSIQYSNGQIYQYSKTIKGSSLSNPCNIQSYQIFDGNKNRYSGNIDNGMVIGMELKINDSGITKTYLENLIKQGKVKVNSINSNFELRNDTFVIDNIAESNNGVSYTITCDSIEYMGLNRQLALSIDYGDPAIEIRKVYYDILKCIPKSNDYYDRRYYDDDDDVDKSSSKAEIAPPTPNIIITEYDYGGGNVKAAGNFKLKITFKNTSKKLPIDNIVMKVTVPEAFTMTSSSNTFFVEKLSRDSSIVRTMDLSVKPNAEPISHPIKIAFSFEAVIDEARKQFTSEEEISIPVAQLDRFSMNTLEFPEMIYVGEGANVEASFINKGKTPVYNVSAEIAGNISQPGQKQFIGNIEAGKEDSADFTINADMPGDISGEVIITYEDANMNVGELRFPYHLTAQAMDMPPDEGSMAMNPEEMEAEPVTWYSEIPVWSWIVGGVVLIIVAAFVRKIIRIRHEKKLEEQDEDF